MRVIILILIVFTFFSCEKEAKVKLPDTKPVPVLYCYISPDDTLIRLRITQSQPFYGNNTIDIYDPLTNAAASISGVQGSAQLTYNSVSGYYETSTTAYPVLYGAHYQISVVTADGTIATAETTVPSSTIPIDTVNLQSAVDVYGSTVTTFTVSFQDVAGTKNYYRSSVVSGSVSTTGDTLFETNGFSSALSGEQNDKGTTTSLKYSNYAFNPDLKFFDVYLYNASAEYYAFHKSISNYSGEDPFSEPTLTYTNVKNGLGVFAAYAQSKKRVLKN